MIYDTPNLSLGFNRLEEEIARFLDEVGAADLWYLREEYMDFGGEKDPHYLIHFIDSVEEVGDNVRDTHVLETAYPALGYVNYTYYKEENNDGYWQPMDREGLAGRLERFLRMSGDNYLQPPGTYGDLYNPRNEHPKFEGRRFVYQVKSPLQQITGIGPAAFAGIGPCGALRGQLLDVHQTPLTGVIVELVPEQEDNTTVLARETGENGLFWFSRVPAGTYNLRVHGQERVYGIRVLKDDPEPFGIVEGRLYHQEGHPLVGVSLNLQAPDGEVFPVLSGSDGRFRSSSLPAFPYTLRIPDFLFTAQISVVSNAVLGGTLMKQSGLVLAGKQIILKREGVEVGVETTDEHGNFRFHHLDGGRYTIEVPGYRLYSRTVSPSRIEGTITGVPGPVTIELLALEEVVASTRSRNDGFYRFEDLVPGTYRLRSPGFLLKEAQR